MRAWGHSLVASCGERGSSPALRSHHRHCALTIAAATPFMLNSINALPDSKGTTTRSRDELRSCPA